MIISIVPQIENIDNLENNQQNKCHFCESKINLQPTIYKDTIINCCFLCHITVNFDKDYIYHCLLCHSELSQKNIISKTWEFYNKNGYVPLPQEIDEHAKIIKIPVHLFAQFNKKKSKFHNYKFFFTNKVQNMLLDETDDVFEKVPNIKKYDLLQYFKIDAYQIPDDEKNNINKQINKINTNNFEVMTEIQNNLLERYNNLEKNILFNKKLTDNILNDSEQEQEQEQDQEQEQETDFKNDSEHEIEVKEIKESKELKEKEKEKEADAEAEADTEAEETEEVEQVNKNLIG